MRQFFRQINVRQKALVLLSISMVSVFAMNLTSNLWLANKNPMHENLAGLTPLLYTPNTQSLSPEEWLVYLNKKQNNFDIKGVAVYDYQGRLDASSAGDFPSSLGDLDPATLGSSRALIPGVGFTLMVDLKAHTLKIFAFEIMVISALLLIGGIIMIYVILYFINRLITRPILSLTDTTNEIALEQNYSLRARRFYPDEVGTLAENFNFMLNRIQQDDYMMRQEKEKAEQSRLRAIELSKKMHDTNERLAFEVKVRARVEHKLTDFQHYLNNIIDSMPSAIIAIDQDLQVSQWNKGATELTKVPRDNAIYQPLEESCGFLFPYLQKITDSLEKQSINKIERVAYSIGDDEQFLDITIYPLLDTTRSGAVIRIDDVTERTQMENMMVQSEKMMSLGGLAAGMAHEINNPLGAIVQTVQNIKRRLNPAISRNQEVANELELELDQVVSYIQAREIFDFLENIYSAGERAATIVSNMLQFSRQSSKSLQAQDIHSILNRSISIARNEYRLSEGYDFQSINLKQNYDLTLPTVPCISSELEQVILNLLKNAAQALQEYSKQQPDSWQGEITLSTWRDDDSAYISVEDNGPGMDDDTCKHIFEPFFTTKEVGMGTGLGLSVSFFIITTHHKGQMHVQSSIGKGTKFSLQLPIKPPILTVES
ncbi:HAMP domain-containing protein [Bermanella marisrubri]|uniref:histidine kinase n=1 Tax=Bermanella marisrubri TaxID=207949 RepID=Q1MXS6_9GAMM|nr:ATP-binding protein [Bermanella marisrubri]EAT10775.1 probable two-component sensor [Oceanobacter sp. RED65] [Bermanella marisrubri]QIZ83482.1 HAMP domain-containing protein [Bermanella marisrubri]